MFAGFIACKSLPHSDQLATTCRTESLIIWEYVRHAFKVQVAGSGHEAAASAKMDSANHALPISLVKFILFIKCLTMSRRFSRTVTRIPTAIMRAPIFPATAAIYLARFRCAVFCYNHWHGKS